VAGTDDVDWFVKSGKLGAQAITEILTKHEIGLDHLESVLDFGCGCGRVIRHLCPYESIKLYGTDYNKPAIAWCDENLNFAVFSTNPLEPPTRYRDHSFDLIYAFSVFTHLTEQLQGTWMQELHRILKPGGYLIISVHGDDLIPHLSKSQLARYQQGEIVVLGAENVGQNDCVVLHPESYVRNVLAKDFDVLEFVPEGAAGNPPQGAYLLRSREA
jgi:SAM-dependent methyltransferase